jgi:UDP-glucose 4-epimerase
VAPRQTSHQFRESSLLVVGSGFIGWRVAKLAADTGHDVTMLSHRSPDPALPSQVEVHIGEAGDRPSLGKVLRPGAHVLWCAGSLLPAAPHSEDPAVDLAPLELALSLLTEQGGKITFLSSGGTVYGDPTISPTPEDSPLAPRGVYATTKVRGEQAVTAVGPNGVRSVILRCGNVYGPRQQPGRSQGVVATALDCARRGTPMPFFGDGSAVRDYVFVNDLVSVALATVVDPDFPAVVNVGTGRGTRLDELVDLVSEVTGVEVTTDKTTVRAHDIGRVVLDITRLREAIPSYAPWTLREGLTVTWEAMSTSGCTPS